MHAINGYIYGYSAMVFLMCKTFIFITSKWDFQATYYTNMAIWMKKNQIDIYKIKKVTGHWKSPFFPIWIFLAKSLTGATL